MKNQITRSIAVIKSWITRKNTVISLIIGIAFIFIIIMVIGDIARPRVEVPDQVRQSVDFGVVLPDQVPKNFSVTSSPAYDSATQVVTTSFKNKNGVDVTISQQKKPDIDLKQIDTRETYLTDVGSVYVLKGEPGRLQAIIETEDSWVMLSCDDSIGLPGLKDIISSLIAKDL